MEDHSNDHTVLIKDEHEQPLMDVRDESHHDSMDGVTNTYDESKYGCCSRFCSISILSAIICLLITLIIILLMTNPSLIFQSPSTILQVSQSSTTPPPVHAVHRLLQDQTQSQTASDSDVAIDDTTKVHTSPSSHELLLSEGLEKEKTKVKELEAKLTELESVQNVLLTSIETGDITSLPPPLRFPHRIEAHQTFYNESLEFGSYKWYFDRYDSDEYSYVKSPPTLAWYEDESTVAGNTTVGSIGQFPFDVSHRRFLSAPEEYQKYDHALEYDPKLFYSAGVPILWSDTWGVTHWNREAERQFYHLFREQQQPAFNSVPCHERKFVIIEQRGQGSGLLSRYHVAMNMLQVAEVTGRELILTNRAMTMAHSGADDFLKEGITRYFMPISECTASDWFQSIERDPAERAKWFNWKHPEEAFRPGIQEKQFLWFSSSEYGGEGWFPTPLSKHHSPIRKHMFSYGGPQLHPQRYESQEAMLKDRSQHSKEHIYLHPSPMIPHRKRHWTELHRPFHTDQDHMWLDFTWYMFALWMWAPLPRIQAGTIALKHFWESNLVDQYATKHHEMSHSEIKSLYASALDHTISIHIRRADKWDEDDYWQSHHFFRDLGLYGYTMNRRAEMNGRPYQAIFFMSDESESYDEVLNCSRAVRPPQPFNWTSQPITSPLQPSTRPSGCRSEASEYSFSGIPIIDNIYSPYRCTDPFIRNGFEQFLVSINFMSEYTEYAIGITESNVDRFLKELMYGRKQVEQQIESLFTVFEVTVDDFTGKNGTG